MLAKYKIEYAVPFHGHEAQFHHTTEDPVACEEFLTQLLERGFKIKGVMHAGVALPVVEFYRMLQVAAGMLATRYLCRSLDIEPDEAHQHFGSPA